MSNLNYFDVNIQPNSMIYLDIPYKNTTKYSTGDFDHDELYSYVKDMALSGHDVFVSEYKHNVPDEFDIVWERGSKKDMRNRDDVMEKNNRSFIYL